MKFDQSAYIFRISQEFQWCQDLRDIARLSKKYFLDNFANFAYNKIRHLEAIKLLFWGFSTVSADICQQPRFVEKTGS